MDNWQCRIVRTLKQDEARLAILEISQTYDNYVVIEWTVKSHKRLLRPNRDDLS